MLVGNVTKGEVTTNMAPQVNCWSNDPQFSKRTKFLTIFRGPPICHTFQGFSPRTAEVLYGSQVATSQESHTVPMSVHCSPSVYVGDILPNQHSYLRANKKLSRCTIDFNAKRHAKLCVLFLKYSRSMSGASYSSMCPENLGMNDFRGCPCPCIHKMDRIFRLHRWMS